MATLTQKGQPVRAVNSQEQNMWDTLHMT